MTRHVLVVRLDSMGDVLICGPAVRAVAAHADRVVMLAGPLGAPAARLLPGVAEVIEWDCPWIAAEAPPVDRRAIDDVVRRIAAARVEEAVILTSFHQSALPTALLLRLAGLRRISAVSEDYPGSLLDVRIPPPPDAPEPERMLAVAAAAGFLLPPGDDGRLAVRDVLAPPALPRQRYAVVHPGAAVDARRYPAALWRETVTALTGRGWHVLVTGSPAEAELTATVAAAARLPGHARDCGGAFGLLELAAVLQQAAVVVVGNTGPAHLAAAVGTPVVSLFSPVVPARRWAPYGVPTVLLGDQHAACRDSRARDCPIAGHPCLSAVSPGEIVTAVESLAPAWQEVPA